MLLFTIISIAASIDTSSVLLIYSNSTSPEALSSFSSFSNQVNIDQIFSYFYPLSLLIDLTNSSVYFPKLDSFARSRDLVYLTLTQAENFTYSQYRFYALPDPAYEAVKMSSLLSSLRIPFYSIISSSEHSSIDFSYKLKSISEVKVNSVIVVSQNIENTELSTLMKRLINSEGYINIVVVGKGKLLRTLQSVLQDKTIKKNNLNIIYPSFAADQVYMNNSVILSQAGTRNSTSFEQTMFLAVQSTLENIQSTGDLEKTCFSSSCSKTFEIIYTKNNSKLVVGYLNDSLSYINITEFPGNSFSTLSKTPLVIYIANGTSEKDNSINYTTYSRWYKGALYAIEQANLNEEVVNYEFVVQPTNCGNLIYDEQYFIDCISKLPLKNPLAYLSSNGINGAIGTYLAFRKMGIFLPQISPLLNSDVLNNRTVSPEFVKMGLDINSYQISGPRLLYLNFKWDSLVLLATQESIEQYNITVNLFATYKYKILNMNYSVLPANYTRNDFEKYKDYFQFARDLKCRVFVIISNQAGHILEGLYDIGLRRGDFITFWERDSLEFIVNESDPVFYGKRQELIEGNLVVGYREWEGATGERLKAELSKKFDDINYMCMTYEAFQFLKDSIIQLQKTGDDFENPITLAKTIKAQKRMSCLGNAFFHPSYNARPCSKLLFDQLFINETTGKLDSFEFIVTNRFDFNKITILAKDKWVNETSNFIDFGVCGHDPRSIQDSNPGRVVMIITCTVILSLTLVFSATSLRKFKSTFKEFQTGIDVTINDLIFLCFFGFELFQFLSLEPEDGVFASTLKKFNFFLGFNFLTYFDLHFNNFWKFYLWLIIGALYFTVFCVVFLLNVFLVLQRTFLFEEIMFFSRFFVILLAHIGYFPVVYLLLDIVDCRDADGDSITSSFLYRDCTIYCYQGVHLTYTAIGIVSLVLFSVTASYARIFLESFQPALNIRTKPHYLALLSIFQITLISVKRIVAMYNSALSGLFVSLILFLFSILTWIIKPFNYRRADIYQSTVVLASSWGVFISSVFVAVSRIFAIYVIAYFGILALVIAGFMVSLRHPKGFQEVQGIPIHRLIKFQFLRSYNVYDRESLYYAKDEEKNPKMSVNEVK